MNLWLQKSRMVKKSQGSSSKRRKVATGADGTEAQAAAAAGVVLALSKTPEPVETHCRQYDPCGGSCCFGYSGRGK
jgi:hypothetical protein